VGDAQPLRLTFNDFDLDEANARLRRDGQPVALPPKALAVLCALARQRGQLVTRNALLDAVWGHRHLSDSALKTAIGELRAALGDDPRAPRFIETVARFGYRFIAGTTPARPTTPLPPAPTAPAAARLPAMVGRAAALALLREAWERAGDTQQQLVWVVGEAGVGKSTLIEHFTATLPADAVVHGQCVEHSGSGEPYLPLLEVLRELCRRDPQLPPVLRAVAPTWIAQLPWLLSEAERAALQRELVGAHQARMLRELRELLERLSARAPLTVVLEDLHWSDLETLRMLEYFARSARGLKVLWLASFRLTQVIAEDHPLRGLRQELRLHRLCTEILLDSFSEAEVSDYLQRRFPKARIAEQSVKRLHAHTDGLPLFVSNVVDTLCAQEDAGAESPRWLEDVGGELPVPESLAGVIERQIRRLPEDLQLLLDASSVSGMEFRAAPVAELVARDPAWVAQQCDELARQGLWLRSAGIVELPDGSLDSRFAFLHALYQHVCYQRIAASQRVRYHRQLARILEGGRAALDYAPAELALHFERGHDSLAALRCYGEAAQSAMRRFAPREAAQLAEHGLSLLERAPAGVERLELEFQLLRPRGAAAALLHGVASPEVRANVERVRALLEQLPMTAARAVALDGMGWVHYVRGEFEEALRLARRLDEVAHSFGDTLLAAFACNLAGVALVNQGKLTEAWAYLQRGIAACAQLPDERPMSAFVIDPECSMHLNASPALANLGRIAEARAQHAAGQARAERIRQPISLMLAYWSGGMLEARLDNIAAIAAHAARLAEIVEDAMLPQGEGPALWLRGLVEAHGGEPRQGYAHIREGFARHARLGMWAGCPEVLSYATEALILARDWEAAQRELEEARALAQRIGERLVLPALHLLSARIAQGRGDDDAALAAVRDSLAEARAQQAPGLELKALVALARLPRRTNEDLAALAAAASAAVAGGNDTPAWRAAQALVAAAH
jgi:DNA-binding winged helix-turn-helix (wHTH) protein/tetratricopeptide (TPR) repeat protein